MIDTMTVQAYEATDWRSVAMLVEQSSNLLVSSYAGMPRASVKALAVARVRAALENAGSASWVFNDNQTIEGFASVSHLPWDSEQLGQSAARVNYLLAQGDYEAQRRVKDTLLDALLDHCKQTGARHLSVRVDAADTSSLHALEARGFETVDGIITFARDLSKSPPIHLPPPFQIRLATAEDAASLSTLARTAYTLDRFHADPAISKERADELHAIWLRNSCSGKAADGVVIGEDNEGLLGFVTCKLQADTTQPLGRTIGTIVLVATVDRARGRGVAAALTMASLAWFYDRRAEIVEVGTQLRNIPAARVYQRCGFNLVGSSISLRKLIKGSNYA